MNPFQENVKEVEEYLLKYQLDENCDTVNDFVAGKKKFNKS